MFWLRRKSFTKMMNPDYGYIAQGYGIPYQRVTDRMDLADAVKKMLSTDGPFILECQIKEEDNVLPMTPPGMDVDKMMLEI
jgi:acetolactate synthase-1/2/3 large subunit